MSELGNFADLANVKVGDVKPPIPGPVGHYKCLFTGPMKQHKAQSGNQAMRFPFKPVEPMSDVDPEAWAQFQQDGGFGDKQFTIDFWMSPDARYRFTNFGVAMGHSDQLNLLELAEALATAGEPFVLEMSHEPAKNKDGSIDDTRPPYMRWDNPTPVGEG